MIVKLMLPQDRKLSPVSVYCQKAGLIAEIENLNVETMQALKGDIKGYFEAEICEGVVVLGNRINAQPW